MQHAEHVSIQLQNEQTPRRPRDASAAGMAQGLGVSALCSKDGRWHAGCPSIQLQLRGAASEQGLMAHDPLPQSGLQSTHQQATQGAKAGPA